MNIFIDKDTNEFVLPKYVVAFGCDAKGNCFIRDVTGQYHKIENTEQDMQRIIKRELEKDEDKAN